MTAVNRFIRNPEDPTNTEASIRHQVRKNFKRMPVMYCELLENKEKIKPELVNREFIDTSSTHSEPSSPEKSFSSIDKSTTSNVSKNRDKSLDKSLDKSPDKSLDFPSKSIESTYSGYEKESNRWGKESASSSPLKSERREEELEKEEDELSKRLEELLDKGRSRNRSESHSRRRSRDNSRDPSRDRSRDRSADPNRRRDDRDRREDYRDRREDYRDAKKYVASQVAPSLYSDLKYNKKVVEEIPKPGDTDKMKRELLFKLQLLKQSYKDFEFNEMDEFTMHSNYDEMVEKYDMILKKVSIDKDVSSYRGYLTTAFYAIEHFIAPWLQVDMTGFAQEQIVHMTKYDALLIELGEKHYIPSGSQWPVEVRLLGLICMQTALFVISKQFMNSFKTNNLFTPPSVQKKQGTKMSGPPSL